MTRIKLESDSDFDTKSIAQGRVLVGTSQGNPFDRPPEHWLLKELEAFGVIDVENPTKPDLEGPIHPIFKADKWPDLRDTPERYAAFKPSLILATKLLKTGGPFLSSLIPRVQKDSNNEFIVISENPTAAKLKESFDQLDIIAQHTEWRENPMMWPKFDRQGLTVPRNAGIEPDQPVRDEEDVECWESATERDIKEGFTCRRITVFLASQFGDALVKLAREDPVTMRYSQAVFICAVTMVHEIAHVVYASRFSHKTWQWEPLVKGEVLRELGTSFVAWLFKGWLPENICDPSGEEDRSFRYGCCWYKQRRHPVAYPSYMTVHSMPMSHIQKILSQKSWNESSGNDLSFSFRIRSQLLAPSLPFPAATTARIATKTKYLRTDRSPGLSLHSETWDFHDPDWETDYGRWSHDGQSPYFSPKSSVKSEDNDIVVKSEPTAEDSNLTSLRAPGMTVIFEKAVSGMKSSKAVATSKPCFAHNCQALCFKAGNANSFEFEPIEEGEVAIEQEIPISSMPTPSVIDQMDIQNDVTSVKFFCARSSELRTPCLSSSPALIEVTPSNGRHHNRIQCVNHNDGPILQQQTTDIPPRRSRRLQGLGPELLEGLPATKRPRVTRK